MFKFSIGEYVSIQQETGIIYGVVIRKVKGTYLVRIESIDVEESFHSSELKSTSPLLRELG